MPEDEIEPSDTNCGGCGILTDAAYTSDLDWEIFDTGDRKRGNYD